MIYVYMIKMMVTIQFLLSLVLLEVIANEFECDQMSWNHESINLSLLSLLL